MDPLKVFENPESSKSPKAAARAARRAEKKKAKVGQSSAPLQAKTPRQREFLDHLWARRSVIVAGPAGVGKTYLPARIAAQYLQKGTVEKVVIARVTVSDPKHALGFLPGKLDQKLKPWLIPVLEGIKAEVGNNFLEQAMQDGRIEIASFEHMRGRTFENAFVLLDEAQNASFKDLKLFLTRIGEGTQVVVTGDLDQIDVKDSGLQRVMSLCNHYQGPMEIVRFADEDVVRSVFTKEWVRVFREAEEDRDLQIVQSPVNVNLDELPAFIHTPGMSRNKAS